MLSCSLDLTKRNKQNATESPHFPLSWRKPAAALRRSPVPVGLSNSGVVDNGGQQRREGPEQQSGQELAEEGALDEGEQNRKHKRWMDVFSRADGVRRGGFSR